MKTCDKCGATEDRVEFIKDRPKRRPRCRPCDNRIQRENRYRRIGQRRRQGESSYSYTCDGCGETFEVPVTSGVPKQRCDECRRLEFNARARAKWREKYLRRAYGISVDEFDRMRAEQEGRCAICGATEPGGRHEEFVVDHDHDTGAVRALLCNACNTGIGLMREDPSILASAIEYVRRHSPTTDGLSSRHTAAPMHLSASGPPTPHLLPRGPPRGQA